MIWFGHLQDLATEIILTLGQAFEVAYQLVLREGSFILPETSKKQEPAAAAAEKKREPPEVDAVKSENTPAVVAAPTGEKAAEAASATATPVKATEAPRRSGKPPELPPKPKLILSQNHIKNPSGSVSGTPSETVSETGARSLKSSQNYNHARSYSAIDCALSRPRKVLTENRLQSESNLAGLQTSKMPSMPSSVSIASSGSGRAPLAAKDEL